MISAYSTFPAVLTVLKEVKFFMLIIENFPVFIYKFTVNYFMDFFLNRRKVYIKLNDRQKWWVNDNSNYKKLINKTYK